MRIRLTLDIERRRPEPEPQTEGGTEYVPGAQVERAYHQTVGFTADTGRISDYPEDRR